MMETDVLGRGAEVQAQVQVMQLPGDLVGIAELAGREAAALVALAHAGRGDVAEMCLGDLPRAERAPIWVAIGDAALLGGDAEMARRGYRRARDLGTDRVDTAAALVTAAADCGLALVAMGQGDLWAAALELRYALDTLHCSALNPRARLCDRVRLELRRLQDEVLDGFVLGFASQA